MIRNIHSLTSRQKIFSAVIVVAMGTLLSFGAFGHVLGSQGGDVLGSQGGDVLGSQGGDVQQSKEPGQVATARSFEVDGTQAFTTEQEQGSQSEGDEGTSEPGQQSQQTNNPESGEGEEGDGQEPENTQPAEPTKTPFLVLVTKDIVPQGGNYAASCRFFYGNVEDKYVYRSEFVVNYVPSSVAQNDACQWAWGQVEGQYAEGPSDSLQVSVSGMMFGMVVKPGSRVNNTVQITLDNLKSTKVLNSHPDFSGLYQVVL